MGAQAANPDGTVNITLTTDAPALWLTLTTLASVGGVVGNVVALRVLSAHYNSSSSPITGISQGRVSDNAFLLLPGTTVVTFLPWGGPADIKLLSSSLRFEHVATYQ